MAFNLTQLGIQKAPQMSITRCRILAAATVMSHLVTSDTHAAKLCGVQPETYRKEVDKFIRLNFIETTTTTKRTTESVKTTTRSLPSNVSDAAILESYKRLNDKAAVAREVGMSRGGVRHRLDRILGISA